MLGCLVLTFLIRASFLSLKGMSLTWLIIWSCLYPLCCISLSIIDLKLVSFELVLRYLFVSPLGYSGEAEQGGGAGGATAPPKLRSVGLASPNWMARVRPTLLFHLL